MEEKKKSTSVLRISLLSLGMSGMLLAGPDVVQGQIYKWVDAEGRIHFSDSPIGKADVVDEELPPTSQFISPRPPTPPTPPEQTEAEEDTQDAEDAASPTTQTTDQAAEEEIGIGQYGLFGPDGPDGPSGLVDPQAGKK